MRIVNQMLLIKHPYQTQFSAFKLCLKYATTETSARARLSAAKPGLITQWGLISQKKTQWGPFHYPPHCPQWHAHPTYHSQNHVFHCHHKGGPSLN